MKKNTQLEKDILDAFYNDAPNLHTTSMEQLMQHMSPDEKAFAEHLSQTMKKIDVLDDGAFDFEINTLSIIEQGTQIRESKSALKEFALFLLFAIAFLAMLTAIVVQLGMTVWMIMQLVMIVIVPWLIIPVLALKRKAGEV